MTSDEKLDILLANVGDIKTDIAVVQSKQDSMQTLVEKQNGRVGKSEDTIILIEERIKGLPERVRSLENFKLKAIGYAGGAGAVLGFAGDWIKHKMGIE